LLIVNFFYVCLREQSFLMGMVLSEISLSDTFNQKKRKNLEIFGLLYLPKMAKASYFDLTC